MRKENEENGESAMNLRHLACLGCLLLAPLASADQDDPRLEDLFQRLKVAANTREAAPVEALIWQVWIEHDNAGFNNQMLNGIQQMNSNALQAALATFDQLVQQAPDFAEAWNKRATIHFLLGNYAESEADIARTLQLEPYHFGALSGRGLVRMAQGQYEAARSAFNAALEVNPNMPAVKSNIEAINAYLRGTTI